MRAERARRDVVIVGGGPAGSAAAIHLARAGVNVTLVERARFPRAKACAECLSVEAQQLLDSLGTLAAVARAGVPLRGMRVRSPAGDVIRGEYRAIAGYAPSAARGLAVRRERLDTILLEAARAAGAHVVQPARVTSLSFDAQRRVNGVEIMDERGSARVLGGGMVIGADGLRSIVARRLGLHRRRRGPGRVALVSHFANVRDVDDWGELHVERDGFVGIADVGGGTTTVALVVPQQAARAIGGDAEGFTRRWLASHPQLAPRFARAVSLGSTLATGPFAQRVRRAWAPGALLVGDAADFFDPFTGEGIYSALRGAELCVPMALEAIERSGQRDVDDGLRAYDRARRREFAGKWMVERLVAMATGSPRLMNRAARSLGARPDLAALLVGVTNHYVPAGAVLSPRYLGALFLRPSLHPMLSA